MTYDPIDTNDDGVVDADVDNQSVNTEEATVDELERPPLTSWRRYPRNPVLKPSIDGFDSNRISSTTHIVKNGEVWVYYEGASSDSQASASDWQIGLAKSTDGFGLQLSKFGSNPVITNGGSGDWNEESVADPSIVEDGDGTFTMAAIGDNTSGGRAIGIWRSSDGENWTPDGSNPVIGLDQNYFDVSLVLNNGTYYLFIYHAGSTNQLECWTSSDATTWTSQGAVFSPESGWWENGQIRGQEVGVIDGTWQMMFGDANQTYFGVAESNDPLDFDSGSRYAGNPVTQKQVGSWEQDRMQDPHWGETPQDRRILYYNDSAEGGNRVGAMIEDPFQSLPEGQQSDTWGDYLLANRKSDYSYATADGIDAIPMTNLGRDRARGWDATNAEYGVSEDGVYYVKAQYQVTPASAPTDANAFVHKNGNIAIQEEHEINEVAPKTVDASDMLALTSGDVLDPRLECSSDATLSGTTRLTKFTVAMVQDGLPIA